MSRDSAGSRPTNVRWLIFSLAAAASWLLYLHRYTWNFIRPELKSEYGFSNVQLEGIFTVFNLSYGLGQIPSGIVCDYFGVGAFMAVIILLWSLILPTVGLTSNPWGLYAMRLGFGAAQAGCYPALSRVTKAWFPIGKRTIVQGFIASFFGRSGGAMASIVMGTLLMGYCGFSWRFALLVMASAGVVLAVGFAVFFRESPDRDQRVNEAEQALIERGDATSAELGKVLPFSRVIRNGSMRAFIVEHMLNAGADTIYVSTIVVTFSNRTRSTLRKQGYSPACRCLEERSGGIWRFSQRCADPSHR